jgi:hypothetical protein
MKAAGALTLPSLYPAIAEIESLDLVNIALIEHDRDRPSALQTC